LGCASDLPALAHQTQGEMAEGSSQGAGAGSEGSKALNLEDSSDEFDDHADEEEHDPHQMHHEFCTEVEDSEESADDQKCRYHTLSL
jgi:hypothetical protein